MENVLLIIFKIVNILKKFIKKINYMIYVNSVYLNIIIKVQIKNVIKVIYKIVKLFKKTNQMYVQNVNKI